MICVRKTCRLCNGRLNPLFSLGNLYMSDFVAKDKVTSGIQCPLSAVRCNSCYMVQLEHTPPVDYTKYWYRSGVTQTMRDALADVVKCAQQYVHLDRDDIVLDIGSNDGTLLRCYKGVRTVGFEPALNVNASNGVDCLVQDKWSAEAYHKWVNKPAKIVTACGMLYDLEYPQEFITDVAAALHPDGVFVAQLMCLKQTLESQDIGNFCHEHLEYYTLHNLETMLNKARLKLIKLESNSVNGGSYRLYAVHRGRLCREDQALSMQRKADWFACSKDNCEQFFARAERNKKACVEYVDKELSAKRTVFLYGASTKGNTILQYYGLDSNKVLMAADKSPEKHGLYTVGTGIPVFSEDTVRAFNPDNFLVMPYAFIDEFVKREAGQTWRLRGGKFLVPLPEFKAL